jgi:hypothetical protein
LTKKRRFKNAFNVGTHQNLKCYENTHPNKVKQLKGNINQNISSAHV